MIMKTFWLSLSLVSGLVLIAPVYAGEPSERFHEYTKRVWYPEQNDPRARAECLEHAQELLRVHLARQNPPIRRVPPLEWIDTNLVRSTEPGEPRYFSEFREERYPLRLEIEMTSDQVRQLHGEQRMLDAGKVFLGLFVAAGLLWLFSRLDHWTRGYLTVPLAVGFLLGLGGVAVGVFFLITRIHIP